MTDPAYEKMGAFYLGKTFDFEKREVQDDLLLYDAKDLTTHAVCVGMTGSGKTGLCVSLLEEAAIDGIPAICIDPKGDLGNLLLTFPKLAPEDFEPWVDEGEATRKGMDRAAYAKDRAALWTKGLGQWGQDGARIQRLRDAADLAIYTPGSSAGLPITVLKSFTAPPEAVRTDRDAMRERVLAAVSGLLALLGIDGDPIRSREHILLSNILDAAWREGTSLDLGQLIAAIQKPSFERIGVMDLESFYPAKERFELAMTLNNLLASPGFGAWLEGEPLDIQRLLWTPEGKPRISILNIAHLGDAERMFFVTLLLGEMVTWMRAQSGTSSLRALLYMDEVFGYFPPTANPPSKRPLLTLMKQARAFGLGVVLATQNPVDLDYKGLSNAGTWFLGRLQTERDQARVLDGLEGASAQGGHAFDRAAVEKILAGVGSRVFMMNNVHDNAPVLFHTRWAMSYLRGPLTRTHIQTLMADRKAGKPAAVSTPLGSTVADPAAPVKAKVPVKAQRPALPPEIAETFVHATAPVPTGSTVMYRPHLLSDARLHFVKAAQNIDTWREVRVMAPLAGKKVLDPWKEATIGDIGALTLADGPLAGLSDARYGTLPKEASQAKRYATWQRSLKSALYRDQTISLWRCAGLRMWSEAGETEGDFKTRVQQVHREKRDVALEKLKAGYGKKLARLQERVRKAEQKLEREEAQVGEQRTSTLLSWGQTILGAVLGRKTISSGTASRAGTSMRRQGRLSKEKDDVVRAKEDLEAAQEAFAEMEVEFAEKLDTLKADFEGKDIAVTASPVKPRKSDIETTPVRLLWAPWAVDMDGVATPLY